MNIGGIFVKKRWIVMVALFILVFALGIFRFGCGSNPTSSSGTTVTDGDTTTVAGETISVKGKASTASSSGLAKFVGSRAVVASGTIKVGLPSINSEDLTYIATGTTDSQGAFDLTINKGKFTLTKEDTEEVTNVMVLVFDSDGAQVAGGVIPMLQLTSPDAYVMPTENDLIKQKIALAGFKDGVDPKNFDYASKIDRNFNDLTGYTIDDTDKFDKMGAALLNNEAVRDEIAAGLGISSAVLIELDNKSKELHMKYVDPVIKAAFDAGSPPDRADMDNAFSLMEIDMKNFAFSQGLSEQQFMDLKNMHDQHMQGEMQQQLGSSDPAFKEISKRNMGNKMIDVFYMQFDAASLLGQAKPAGGQSFADKNPTRFAAYLADRDTIADALKAKQNDASITNPMDISNFLRGQFFDKWLFPPPNQMSGPAGEGKDEMTPEQMEASMQAYISGDNARIMVGFMDNFSQQERQDIFQGMGMTLQPIFQNRFENQQSDYFMGPEFWQNSPTAAEIQTRMAAFKAALDSAVTTIAKNPFEAAFGVSASTNRYIDAFKVLNAPPDMM